MSSSLRVLIATMTATALSLPLLLHPFAIARAQAGSVENLERERAVLIEAFLDPAADPATRSARVAQSSRRLLDLERQVLRDDALLGRNTPTVRRAFANYDLTFLVHAGAERGLPLIDLWLAEIGVSTDTLMTARVGRR